MSVTVSDLPGLDCGLCGFKGCEAMAERLAENPDLLKRCVPRASGYGQVGTRPKAVVKERPRVLVEEPTAAACSACAVSSPAAVQLSDGPVDRTWLDSLGREFDFILEHFPEEPGPREIIIPHNPILTREMEIEVGETLIGRPLGMSCGCPITHCGIVQQVDMRTGVIVWCVTGPLRPRQEGFKDLGYYIAEGYEGLIRNARVDVQIGRRYYFQPRMCMLQWRHSGLVNYINRTDDGLQIRIEGLWIG
jgi:uncharacterized Fe-S cluster-containing protein